MGNTESGIATECLRRQKPAGCCSRQPERDDRHLFMVEVGLASKFDFMRTS